MISRKDKPNKLSFFERLDNFIDTHFKLILFFGIPIFALDIFMVIFWLTIYFS